MRGKWGQLGADGCMTPPLYIAPFHFGLCGMPDLYTFLGLVRMAHSLLLLFKASWKHPCS